MSTEVAKNTTFEEKMFEKMREQMGTLLTETELKAILEKSIDKAFFQERPNNSGGYHAKPFEPLFVELMRKEIEPMIAKGAQQWLEANQEKVGEILQQQLGDSAAQMVANAFSTIMSHPMQDFSFQLQERLRGSGVTI